MAVIAETDILETDLSTHKSRLPGCRRRLNGGRTVKNHLDAPKRRGALEEIVDHPSDAEHRSGHDHEVGHELDELAQRDPPLHHVDAAQVEKNYGGGAVRDREDGPERVVDAGKSQALVHVVVVDGPKSPLLRLLLRVGLDDTDAGQVFLSPRR